MLAQVGPCRQQCFFGKHYKINKKLLNAFVATSYHLMNKDAKCDDNVLTDNVPSTV